MHRQNQAGKRCLLCTVLQQVNSENSYGFYIPFSGIKNLQSINGAVNKSPRSTRCIKKASVLNSLSNAVRTLAMVRMFITNLKSILKIRLKAHIFPSTFPDIAIEVYDWELDVNLKGQFYFDHAVMKQMREQKSGLIVNIGSITDMEGDGRVMDYPTAKSGAMFGLTKSLAQYGSKYGVRCVCVSPGPVLTKKAMANMHTLVGRAAGNN